MSQVNADLVEKNFDSILQAVGTQSFVNWEKFTHSSAEIINSIDEFNKRVVIFRECQHRNFIQAMKKLKSLDLPDLISAVKSKKLPKEALRGVLPRFKVAGDKIELTESVETLKQNATKQFEDYVTKNNAFLEELKKFQTVVNEKIKQFGFVEEQSSESPIKATVKFTFKDQLANKLSDEIKIEYIPGTSYIGLRTYSQIVNSSYELVKEQNERITKEARVQQREHIKNHEKYLQIMNDYLLNGEALVIDGQKLLAKKVGLSDKKLEDSELLMMERGLGNHMLMLQSQLRAKIKQSIPPKKDVPFEKAKEIIVFQTKMIQEKQSQIKKILDGLPKNQETVQTIPMLLALILNDMVYQKYGFEEQDFMKNVSEQVISTNPELAKIFKEMQLAIIKLMQHLGIIPQDVGKYMQNNARSQGQVQNGQSVMMPGMMPTNNPMEMLQMQQMQQMQQMYANQKL